MKKIFGLLVCGFAVAFASCEDKNGEDGNRWFKQPEAVVSGTTVDIYCRTTFGDGVLASASAGFAYAPITDAVGDFVEVTNPAIDGPVLSCQLTGLKAQTNYLIYAFAQVGAERMQSSPIVFETGVGGEEPDPEPEANPTFGSPSSGSVTKNSATISCTFAYGGTSSVSEAYFSYRTASGTDQRAEVSNATGDKSATLSGLTASTTYTFRLNVVVDGTVYSSNPATFTTEVEGGVDPGPGLTKYSGWAELPIEKVKAGDYYYAYHLCPDVYVPGTSNKQKRRNYAVCYSNALKTAIWVSAPMHDCYAVKNTERTDAYKSDPDISVSQPGKWSGYTRGHMLGSGERLVSNATNKQVFFYSNITPQIGQPYFNTGGGAWNTLEDWVDTQWKGQADTTYQIIGTYFKDAKKVVSGTTIPTYFYKVLLRTKGHTNKWVVNCSRDELQCVAIMVQHRAYSKEEVAKPSQYESRGMLYTVKQIEEMTGITFFPNVPNAPKDTYNTSDWGL